MAKNGRIFSIPGTADTYKRHEKLEIKRVESLKRHHEESRRYLRRHSPRRFKIKAVAKLPGVTVWLVNGPMIRRTADIDFTMGGHGYHYRFCPLDEIWIDAIYWRTPDFRTTVWHEYFERHLMRTHRLSYETAHRRACGLEIFLQDEKAFVLPVGTFRQRPGLCGPAALKIYLSYLGRNLSERYLTRLCKANPDKGTDPPDIAAAAQKLGFRVEHRGRPLTPREASRFCRAGGKSGKELRELAAKVRQQAAGVTVRRAWTAAAVKKSILHGLPVLANTQMGKEYGEGHYRLIIGFTEDRFKISDPNLGYCEELISEFMDLWYELEDGTFREGFAIRP